MVTSDASPTDCFRIPASTLPASRRESAGAFVRELVRLPNLLSLSRIAMAGLVWLAPRSVAFLLTLVALAAITDLLDGWSARALAKRRGHAFDPQGMGAWLDPLCDKVFVVSAVAAVVFAWHPGPSVMALILLRDLLQVPLLAAFLLIWGRRVHIDWRAARAGKLTTVVQFAALLSILLWPVATLPLALVCGGLGVIAVLEVVERVLDAAHLQGVAPRAASIVVPAFFRRQPR